MIYCWYQPSYIKLIKRVTRDVDKLVLDITSQFSDNNYCYLLPAIITLWSMFAPLRPMQGLGSSPEKIQFEEPSVSSSVEERKS